MSPKMKEALAAITASGTDGVYRRNWHSATVAALLRSGAIEEVPGKVDMVRVPVAEVAKDDEIEGLVSGDVYEWPTAPAVETTERVAPVEAHGASTETAGTIETVETGGRYFLRCLTCGDETLYLYPTDDIDAVKVKFAADHPCVPMREEVASVLTAADIAGLAPVEIQVAEIRQALLTTVASPWRSPRSKRKPTRAARRTWQSKPRRCGAS